jgi:serine/threonine protein kinase
MNTHENNDRDPNGAASEGMDDPRVVEALDQYLAAIEAGEKPNRQAFLARHGAIAGALAECLDGLDALQVASSSNNRFPGEAEAGTAGEWQPEAPLGDFRIVREIGRGGMGIVYEAVQLSLGRRVALKVLPFAAALDAKQLQRFKNEAQAAAHLHHQNIVPVYAVGVERGVHFYAMQLIEGQNLAQAIADLRLQTADLQLSEDRVGRNSGRSQVAAQPPTQDYQPVPPFPQPDICDLQSAMAQTRPNLSVQLSTQRSDRSSEFFRTIVRLVVQVAEALDYAHGMGIVHRDIKPANLVVDGRGNVWITDFGLAQFHANPGLTQTGDLVGTLRYMSPEQAGGQRVLIDHRTDVYSLGATLYELLTLRPIFDGADRQALLHQIMYEEPRPPRSVDRSIPAELETIVLKAIGKVPSDRYATASDFADDLHRFLRNEPIRARRATPIQRARKWLRRHPSVLAATVVLLVLLTAGSLFSAWLIHGEQDKTQQAYERERQRAQEADERFLLARESVDEMVKIADEELADSPPLQELRRRLLEASVIYYQKLIKQQRDDPTRKEELTNAQQRVQQMLSDLAELQGAGQLRFLNQPSVLDDLHATEEQRRQIRAHTEHGNRKLHDLFGQYHRLTSDERRKLFLELARSDDRAVKDTLTSQQLNRFKQIVLQLQGPHAFRETSVAEALKLTTEQKEQIRAIEGETFFVMVDGICAHGPPDGKRFGERNRRLGGKWPPDKPPPLHEQRLKMGTDRTLAILTPDQAKRWREMTGEPIKGPVRGQCPPPPGGPGGPGEPPDHPGGPGVWFGHAPGSPTPPP